MPASVTEVRTYLLEEPGGSALRSLSSTDPIPYGATVRLEVEVTADEPLHPLSVGVTTDGVARGLTLHMLPDETGVTYAQEVAFPWGAVSGGQLDGLTAPPTFPLTGVPELGGGEYVLHIKPWPLSVGAEGEDEPSYDTSLQLAAPTGGGAAPEIVALDSGLANGRVLPGQPWRPSVQVADTDNDVVAVVFSTYIGGMMRWWLMRNDGRFGSEVSADTYSFLRVGGDWWDRWEINWDQDVAATFSVQALDARGNWSAPARFGYTIAHSEAPLWSMPPDPDGPNITELTASHTDAPPACYLVSATCDDSQAYVCGRILGNHGQNFAMFDDGVWPDGTAGDGVFSQQLWFAFSAPQRNWEVLCYAVPKAGSLCTGLRKVISLPSLG